MSNPTRRTFLRAGVGGLALPAFAASPGEKIVCAVIGVRGRGRSFFSLAGREDTAIATLCDVDANVLGEAAGSVEKAASRIPALVDDFRRVLDDKAIQAVFIAAPHHWHGPIARGPCRRGSTFTSRSRCRTSIARGSSWSRRRRSISACSSTARRCAPARSRPGPAR